MKYGRTTLIVCGAALALVACSTLIPRQGWRDSYGPVVPHDTFPTDCALCHVGGSWSEIKDDFVFDHFAETGLALNGAHTNAQCLLCHNDRGPAQLFAARGCVGCHQDDHRGRLGPDCASCHNENTWRPIEAIRLHAFTRFPLVGPHAAAECFRCHTGAQVGNFEGLSPQCAVCHQADLARATVPDHIAQGWTDDCQRCHLQLGWTPAQFEHPASFGLVGGHALDCNDCHTPGTFAGLSTDCASCHLDTFTQTTNPNHAIAGFSTDCRQCHTVFGWSGAAFLHTPTFPLSGGHNLQTCTLCHQGGLFAGTPTDCAACHLDDFNATTNPNHATAGFGTDCRLCHTTSGWPGAQFAHTPTFPLTGGHNLQTCTSCHQGGVFAGTPTDCASCHLDNFNNTTNPNHATAGFSTDCRLCHTTGGWTGAAFIHTPTFPLTAGHNLQDCTLCHQGGVFAGTPTDCASCHLDNFNNTTNPNHAAAGFSTDCRQCHSTAGWTGAAFIHTPTFPLAGGHNLQDCTLCHQGGVFAGTPTDCASCHLDNFNNTTNPNHQQSGFSTNCAVCHDTIDWRNATFNHSFPINGGPHGNLNCIDCHTNPAATPQFSCIHCHEHERLRTNDQHRGVQGYVWLSSACLSCHPQGRK